MYRLLLITLCTGCWGSTFYVSKSTGSDSHTSTQAQSKSTPWAHLPGMAGCTTGCTSNMPANYTPSAGDIFVQMGCDVWTNSDLPEQWDWSGSSGNSITVTVDLTWYNASNCASAWNRPVYDAQKTALSPNSIIRLSATAIRSYVVFDNIELRGLACTGACGGGQQAVECYNACGNTIVQNLYIHGWNIVTDGNCQLITMYGSGNLAQQNIIDGSDATGASPAGATCYASYPGIVNLKNNVIHDLANGIVGHMVGPSFSVISGNLIYNISESNAGSHPNAIETVGGSATYLIYNNVEYNNAGEALMFGNTGETDYVFGNVFYGILGNNPEGPQVSGQTGMSFTAFSNTIVPGSGEPCITWNSGDGGTFTTVTIENNHCITTAGTTFTSSWNGTTATLTTNLTQTPTVALGQGYTSGETFAYSPTLGINGTVGTGTNLQALCTTIAGIDAVSGAACQSDTTYACTYNQSAETISCPARTTIAKPSIAAWDIGAYQYQAFTPLTLGAFPFWRK